MNDFKFSRFPIGWSNEEISKHLRDRIEAAQAFLLSEPLKTNYNRKKTNSWKPVSRGKK
jgi:hypothetical protein